MLTYYRCNHLNLSLNKLGELSANSQRKPLTATNGAFRPVLANCRICVFNPASNNNSMMPISANNLMTYQSINIRLAD